MHFTKSNLYLRVISRITNIWYLYVKVCFIEYFNLSNKYYLIAVFSYTKHVNRKSLLVPPRDKNVIPSNHKMLS